MCANVVTHFAFVRSREIKMLFIVRYSKMSTNRSAVSRIGRSFHQFFMVFLSLLFGFSKISQSKRFCFRLRDSKEVLRSWQKSCRDITIYIYLNDT